METTTAKTTLIDASKLITEALVRAGSDVFIGYPITPTNLFYRYSQQRFPAFYAAPDEITVLQWMAGFSTAGKLPVTATSFPGLALMVESLNMAYMMELPMVLVIVQRLGPSTGSATTGAQGELALLNGIISGGYPIPVFCPSNFEDAWEIAEKSVKTAIEFRTPVILLSSKEMVMTNKSFDLDRLKEISPVPRPLAKPNGSFLPYKPGKNLIPPFLPVGNDSHRVRFNASTHDYEGLIRKNSPESLANTLRLKEKFEKRMDELTLFDYDRAEGADDLIITYGISADAARDAVDELRAKGDDVSLLILKSLLPVPEEAINIMDSYKRLVFVEENATGQLKELIYGKRNYNHIIQVNKIGSLITPHEIINKMA